MKKIMIVISILVFSITLTSCKADDDDRDVNFYVWGDSLEISWYERIASDFFDESGVNVNIIPATGDYYENLNIYLGSNKNAPDIFFTEQGEILSQLETNRILNLTPYIENGAIDIKSDTNPEGEIELWPINDAYKYDGDLFNQGDYYALIKDWSPDFMLWFNKNHIDEYNEENGFVEDDLEFMEYPSADIPLSWNEFQEMSFKLTKFEDNQIVRYGTMFDRVPWKHLMQWIQMTGTETFIDGKYFNYEAQGVIDSLNYLAEFQKGDMTSAPVIGPTGIGSGEAFANGNLSFAWFGSWAYSAFSFDNVSFNIGIAPPPVPGKTGNEVLTEEDNYGVSAGMIALAINPNSPVKDDAVKFLNFYMTEGSSYMAKKGYNIPGNKLVAESPDYLSPEDSFLREMNAYFLDYAINYTHSVNYNNYITQINVETQFAKHFSTWINNYDPNTIDIILENIADDIKNEID